MAVARWLFVILITALLSACGDEREASVAEQSVAWSAEQQQAFQQFKSNSPQRAAVADLVARSFPAAFNYDELRVVSTNVAPIAQERLVELLGRPSVSFSLVDRPEYLGANRRQLDFDPRELHILLYDDDCLAASAAEQCSYLEAIALRQNVLRARVVHDRREDAKALLSAPPAPAIVPAMKNRLIAQMPQSDWLQLPHAQAKELAQKYVQETLDAEFYEHDDVVYGRILDPFELINTSESEAVCIATASDVFVPSTQPGAINAELRRDANIRVVVFERTMQACNQRYHDGQFALVNGESLAAAQLVRIHDLFNRRLASECDVPAWMTPQGLLHATGGVYRVSVAPPATGRDRWAFDVTVEFAPDKGGEYTAVVAISPWGTRLKECHQSIAQQPIKSG
jgi:hypothetical protein